MTTDAAPRAHPDLAGLLRRIYPCRTIERDGVVVGAWRVVRATVVPLPEGVAKAPRRFDLQVEGFVRDTDGRVRGFQGTLPLNPHLRVRVEAELERGLDVGETRTVREAAFVRCARAATLLTDQDEGAESTLRRHMWTTTWELLGGKVDAKALAHAVEERISTASDRLVDALDAFDPDALEFAKAFVGDDAALGRAWSGIDATFGAGAPLLGAFALDPEGAGDLLGLWGREAAAVRDVHAAHGAQGILRLHARRQGVPVAPGVLRAAMAAVPEALRRAAFGSPEDEQAADDVESATRRLRALREDAVPVTPRGWEAFVALAPAVDALSRWKVHKADRAAFLGVVDGWERAGGALGPDHDPVALRDDLADVDAMCAAFARQVVAPAMVLDGGHDGHLVKERWGHVVDAAQRILTAGEDLAGVVAKARAWRATATEELAVMAEADREGRDLMTWPSLLPVTAHGGMTVVPVTDEAELVDGLSGRAADHLAHRCAVDTHRVVRVLDADGDGVATALLSVSAESLRVVWTSDPDGAEAGAPALEALASLVARHAEGRVRVVAPRAVGAAQVAAASSGYGVTLDSWTHAASLWSGRLPAPLHGMTVGRLADLAAELVRRDGPAWSHVHPVVTENERQAEKRRIEEERAARAEARRASAEERHRAGMTWHQREALDAEANGFASNKARGSKKWKRERDAWVAHRWTLTPEGAAQAALEAARRAERAHAETIRKAILHAERLAREPARVAAMEVLNRPNPYEGWKPSPPRSGGFRAGLGSGSPRGRELPRPTFSEPTGSVAPRATFPEPCASVAPGP